MRPLGFLDEFFSAFGAGDGNFALTPGNANLLTAAGAVVIPMLTVLYAFYKLQILSIFLIPLIGVAGKHSGNSPKH